MVPAPLSRAQGPWGGGGKDQPGLLRPDPLGILVLMSSSGNPGQLLFETLLALTPWESRHPGAHPFVFPATLSHQDKPLP